MNEYLLDEGQNIVAVAMVAMPKPSTMKIGDEAVNFLVGESVDKIAAIVAVGIAVVATEAWVEVMLDLRYRY